MTGALLLLPLLIYSTLFTNVAAAFWAPEFEQSSLTPADQQRHHGRRKSSQRVDGVTL